MFCFMQRNFCIRENYKLSWQPRMQGMKSRLLKEKIQNRSPRFILTHRVLFQSRQSVLKTGFPMLPRVHWPCPNSDCSNRAQSCRHRFGEARPFARGLADSIFLLPDAVARPRQKHLKIPNGDGASANAATNSRFRRIRIYSCN